MPKVSVIIPIYNVEQYLEECLNSVMNQTFKDIEIICVNDGSTDNSPKILKEYAQKDDRIKVINQENQGVCVARNKGIENSSAPYIMFLDSDDWFESTAVEEAYNAITTNNSDVVSFGIAEVREGVKYPREFEKEFLEQYDKQNKIPLKVWENFIHNACGKIFKTEFLLKNSINFVPGLKTGEDGVFNLFCLYNNAVCTLVNSVLYNYRTYREGSATASAEGAIATDIQACEYVLKSEEFNAAPLAQKRITIEKFFKNFSYYFYNSNNEIYKPKYMAELSEFSDRFYEYLKRAFLYIHIYMFMKEMEQYTYAYKHKYRFIPKWLFSIKKNNGHIKVKIMGIKFSIKEGM